MPKKEEPIIQKASKPLSQQKKNSEFSIHAILNKKEEEKATEEIITKKEDLPQNHFTDTDLQTEWILFLSEIKKKNIVIYNAINSFKLLKIDELMVRVMYPSDSAKTEFDKISREFFNHFRRKVNNFAFEIEYKSDRVNLKKEIVTKRTIFEKMVDKNPVLRDLDDLLKFDLS